MIKSFDEIKGMLNKDKPVTVSVAQANDKQILEAIKIGKQAGLINAILVGNEVEIHKLCQEIHLEDVEIVQAEEADIGRVAIEQIHKKKADILMKGLLNTSLYMRAILNKEYGLNDNKLLSLIAAYQVPQYHKLIFCSDSGINVAPDLEKKKQIMISSLQFMKNLGYDCPNVAVLTANELYDTKVEATVHAKALAELDLEPYGIKAIVEGPISFDIAFDSHAAKHKGIDSRVSGDVDLMIFPNMETGNVLGKSWLLFDKALWSSIVVGAKAPVILGSRSDSPEIKFNSIIMACLAIQNRLS